MYVDTHAHLYYDDLDSQLDGVIERAEAAGVAQIVCVGTDLATSRQSITIAETYSGVFATVGVHPHDAKDAPEGYLAELEKLASHPKVVAMGEMGLDYFRNLSPQDVQRDIFRAQLMLAAELGLPAVIHNRDADKDLLDILRKVDHKRSVLHCFSSDVGMAEEAIGIGCVLSFTGNVTFGKNHTASVLTAVSMDRIMLETDCPFVAPVPNRGKLNEPSNIPYIAKRISEIKGTTVEEVAQITTASAREFFGLPA